MAKLPVLELCEVVIRSSHMSLEFVSEPVPIATDADGVVRIGGTRVSLDTLVAAFREGATAETIAELYPALRLGDIYTAIGYYLRHQAELDAYLEQRRQQAAQVRNENEERFNPIGIRDRLLARRHPQG
jgi:uncharacterized protein (DUF433 family)